MFYALGHKKPKKQVLESDEEDIDEDDEGGFLEQKPKKGKFKSLISQSQIDEKKRQ
jgi:hypothetical protein